MDFNKSEMKKPTTTKRTGSHSPQTVHDVEGLERVKVGGGLIQEEDGGCG